MYERKRSRNTKIKEEKKGMYRRKGKINEEKWEKVNKYKNKRRKNGKKQSMREKGQ